MQTYLKIKKRTKLKQVYGTISMKFINLEVQGAYRKAFLWAIHRQGYPWALGLPITHGYPYFPMLQGAI